MPPHPVIPGHRTTAEGTGLMVVAGACCLLAVPAAALVACLPCRRHDVLLPVGLAILVPTGLLLLLTYRVFDRGREEAVLVSGTVMLCVLPFLAAGIVLVVGGAVRRGQAHREGRRPSAGGTPEPADDSGPGDPLTG